MKLRDNNPRVASYVLAALGELAIVGGEDIFYITFFIIYLFFILIMIFL